MSESWQESNGLRFRLSEIELMDSGQIFDEFQQLEEGAYHWRDEAQRLERENKRLLNLLYASRHVMGNVDYLTEQNRRGRDIVNQIRIELRTGVYQDVCEYLDAQEASND